MNRDPGDFLDDMLDYAKQALAFVGQMSWEEFKSDTRTYFATARAIEIVGETARRIPDNIQQRHPSIPWRQIIGMRNVLAHNYDGADPRIIYDTATLFLPDLIVRLADIIADAEQG